MSDLLRTRGALESCEAHLASSDDDTSEIESYLAEYLAVILCADVQEAVLEIVESHAARSCSGGMVGFVRAAFSKLFRSIDKGDLSRLAGMFCDDAKSRFDSAVDDRVITAYSNVVKGRHQVAHARSASVTLADVRNGLAAAGLMLDALYACLAECSEHPALRIEEP